MRSAARFSGMVHERMHGSRDRRALPPDPLWNLRTRDERWICPFCASAVARRPQRSLEDSAALHLEGCRAFALGRGQPRAKDDLLERLAFEELAAAAADAGTWGVFDAEGLWWCPSCLGRQAGVRSRGGVDALVLQSMWRHLRTCPPYLQGLVRPAAEVQRTRDLALRTAQLTQWAAQQLRFEAWRYHRPDGAWICPCCLQAVPEVRLAGDEGWMRSPATATDLASWLDAGPAGPLPRRTAPPPVGDR